MAGEQRGTPEAPLLASSKAEAPPPRNKYVLTCATLASMSTILMGYNGALMSGAQIFMKEDLGLSDAQIEVLAGSMNMFMLVSVFTAGWTADRIGRRLTIVLANAFFLVGALVMTLGASYAVLMAGRFVTSIGVGFGLVIAPVYAAEISPASTRGLLSSLPEICINCGVLLSYVSNFAFASLPVHLGWRVMYAIGVVPPAFFAAGVLAMPESPRWLVMRSRLDEARHVLARTSDTVDEAELRLQEIKEAVEMSTVTTQPLKQGHGRGVWKELLLRPTPTVRRILTAVLGTQFFQQASGIDSIVLYSPLVFKKAGIASNSTVLAATVAVGLVKVAFILVPTLLSDRVGRRPLLLASNGGMTVSLLVLALTLCIADQSTSRAIMPSPVVAAVCVTAAVVYVAMFSIGNGPLAWVYSSEILPLRLRAQGASLGTAMNRTISGVVSMTFISLSSGITMPGSFFIYAGVAAVAWVFVYVRLPETRGRSLEDMEVLFAK